MHAKRAWPRASAVCAAVLAALTVALSGSGCSAPPPARYTLADAAATEIREYEGQQLSSVMDFRENSLSGPRLIDRDTYTLTIGGLVEEERVPSYEDVIGHATRRQVATLMCEEGWEVTLLWKGVLVPDLLDEAGILPAAKVAIFR